MTTATKNTLTAMTEEALKPLYFPRANAVTAQEKKRAKILDELVKEKEDHIREGCLALSDREALTENQAKVYELGIKSTQVWLHGLNAAAAWAPGTRSARQAAMTGVDFNWDETDALFSAAEAKSSALNDELDDFIDRNWAGGDLEA